MHKNGSDRLSMQGHRDHPRRDSEVIPAAAKNLITVSLSYTVRSSMGRHQIQKGASGAVHDNVAPRCCSPLETTTSGLFPISHWTVPHPSPQLPCYGDLSATKFRSTLGPAEFGPLILTSMVSNHDA